VIDDSYRGKSQFGFCGWSFFNSKCVWPFVKVKLNI